MTMFSRRARLKTGEGGSSGRRPKRVKTHHAVEDQVIQEFQDILGQLEENEISGPPIPPYDGGVDEESFAPSELANPPEDALPEPNLKSVPHEPSLQALWIAREIKKLAVYNEKYGDQHGAGSISTASPISPTFCMGALNLVHGNPNQTPDSSLKSSRSSRRKGRQTTKAKDLHLVDLDADDDLGLADGNENPNHGLDLLAALVTNQQIHHALSQSPNLGPGNYEKRNVVGIQFLQSMAADTLPPDPTPAAKLRYSLWRSRNSTPFFAALHILAGFAEVVQAVRVAFRGRLDESTPLTERQGSSNESTGLNEGTQVNDNSGRIYFKDDPRRKGKSLTSRMKLVNRKARLSSVPALFDQRTFLGFGKAISSNANMSLQGENNMASERTEPDNEPDVSIAPEFTDPKYFTRIDPKHSARAIVALNGATAILDDMAYGALKHPCMSQSTGPPLNPYLTPYGEPAPNNYVTPYANPPSGHRPQASLNDNTPQPESLGTYLAKANAANKPEVFKGACNPQGSSLDESNRQEKETSNVKGKERAQERAPRPDDVLESTETDKDLAAATMSTLTTADKEDQDGEEDFTQIDSFLALAAGDDSDSDDETDRNKTVSREMTPIALFPGDPTLESIVQGIIDELATNQNWGHGIGFLTPQAHLYQISNAQRFAEGLREYNKDARINVNCVVSAEHSAAQQTFYNAIIKRITNPYLDGTLTHYSNVVYHNGRAYQAIPGPAHPMYQQQLPYPPPPPPPPPTQLILRSQGPPPIPPPINSDGHASSSRATSIRDMLRTSREFGHHSPAISLKTPQKRSRRSLQPFRSWKPGRAGAFQVHEGTGSRHSPIIIREPLKRKRNSA